MLLKNYRPEGQKEQDKILGILIGDPVDKSISHVTHKEIFQKSGVHGTYEKKRVCLDRLTEEVVELKRRDVTFFAVTMPLKEAIIPYLDEKSEGVSAVNTIEVREGKWIGHNFDGVGCLNAIERVERVQGARVLVLGAGGAAKAAAYEAKKRGADVFIYNRTHRRALKVAKELGLTAMEELSSRFDMIIQATSVGMLDEELPIDPFYISPGIIVMEMVYNPLKTPFVKEAIAKKCCVIFGYEMFAELSFLQLELATKGRIHKDVVFQVVKKFFVNN